jgi:hypothetical protein
MSVHWRYDTCSSPIPWAFWVSYLFDHMTASVGQQSVPSAAHLQVMLVVPLIPSCSSQLQALFAKLQLRSQITATPMRLYPLSWQLPSIAWVAHFFLLASQARLDSVKLGYTTQMAMRPTIAIRKER